MMAYWQFEEATHCLRLEVLTGTRCNPALGVKMRYMGMLHGVEVSAGIPYMVASVLDTVVPCVSPFLVDLSHMSSPIFLTHQMYYALSKKATVATKPKKRLII